MAADGPSALQQLEETSPDLLLADIGLNGDIDGIEVAARAREEHGIPTVFLTAYSDAETMRRARTPEPYGFLVKPFAEQELQATIEIALQQNALRTAQADEISASARLLVRTQEELSATTERLFRVQEQEREEIARDLHDDIGQRLALLQISMQRLWQKLPADVSRTFENEFQQVLGLAVELSGDLRKVSHRLHPSMLDDLGLVVALRQLVETFEERYQMPSRFSARKLPASLPPQVSLAIYRMVQEALHNVARHAGADATVTVALIGNATRLDLTIRDTGKGFEPQRLQRLNGIGLISMVQRAQAVGGVVSIDSMPGQGTRIHVSIPLKPGEPVAPQKTAAADVHV